MDQPSTASKGAARGSVAQCLAASASSDALPQSATPGKDDDGSCILVFLQCRDREWEGDDQGKEAWAKEAAQRCLNRGFAVLRVRTESWPAVKKDHPEWFEPCFRRDADNSK